MKNLTRKLFISMFAVIFAAVAMVTSAYAWFTISGTAKAKAFEANVTAGDGIEISFDEVSWYNTISSKDMNKYLAYLAEIAADEDYATTHPFVDFDVADLTAQGFEIKNLTSQNGKKIEKMAEVNGGTAEEAKAFVDGYIEFNLYFRSPSEGTVTLDPSTKFTSTGINWTPDATVTNPQSNSGEYQTGIAAGSETPVTVYASNALRISVTGTINEAEETVIVARENANNGTDTTTKSFGTAVAQASDDVLREENPATVTSFATAYANAKNFTVNVAGGFTLPTDLTDIPEINEAKDNYVEVVELTEDNDWYTGTITVRVWLEGYDADCFNAILKDHISVELVFTKLEVQE